MEAKQGEMHAAAAVVAESCGTYQPSTTPTMAPAVTTVVRAEDPSQGAVAPHPPPPPLAAAPAAPTLAGVAFGAGEVSVAMLGMRKKRGRPRKYAPDGSLVRPLNPMPISASGPAGEYTPAAAVGAAMKRGRGRPADFVGKQRFGFELEGLGDLVACSSGANFTPHIINVAPGEDVTTKVISFSQQGPRAICILSANGIISSVTLRQPDSSGGTLTYEGRFELLSLSGSFMPSDNGGTRSRSGGISVSLAGPDGRVVGGGVTGLLVAAGPVQIVVGSFLPSYQLEQKAKKPKLEVVRASVHAATITVSSAEAEEAHRSGQGQHSPAPPKTNITTSSFKADIWNSPMQPVVDSGNAANDAKISVPGG